MRPRGESLTIKTAIPSTIEEPIFAWQRGLKIAKIRKKEKIPHHDSLALVFTNCIRNGGLTLTLREKEYLWAISTTKSMPPVLMTPRQGSITASLPKLIVRPNKKRFIGGSITDKPLSAGGRINGLQKGVGFVKLVDCVKNL